MLEDFANDIVLSGFDEGDDAALFAGEGDEEFVMAIRASGAGEAVVRVAALEELVDGLVDDRAPEAELAGVTPWVDGAEVVKVFADQAVEIGLKRPAWAIDGGERVLEADHGGPRGRGRFASVRGLCLTFVR